MNLSEAVNETIAEMFTGRTPNVNRKASDRFYNYNIFANAVESNEMIIKIRREVKP